MKLQTPLKLGMSTDLLYGYRHAWDPARPDGLPFFRPTEKPLAECEIELEPVSSAWGYPEVSLHRSGEDVLSAVFPFVVVPGEEDAVEPTVAAGPLLIGDANRAAALKALSETLGVDLGRTDGGYAVVRLRRAAGRADHPGIDQGLLINPNPVEPDPALGVAEPFRKALTRLRSGRNEFGQPSDLDVTMEQANAYVATFHRTGTHFVSRVEAGDVIFQVFAYGADRFARIEGAYANRREALQGKAAIDFRNYTTDGRGSGGFVRQYGRLHALSGDPALAASVKAGDWKDPVFAETDSIFAVYEPRARITADRLDGEFAKVAPIRVELRPLAPFVEPTRRKVWRRVFKGCMYQKFPGGVEPRFESADTRNYAALLPTDEPGLLSTIATPTINTYKTRLDLGDLRLVAKEEVKDLTLFANCLQHTGSGVVDVPGRSIALAAQVISLDPKTAHTLSLADGAFDSYVLACAEFHGCLVVANASRTERHTVVDGLRYVSTSGGREGRADVRIDKDVRTPPPAAMLPRLKSSLEFSLVFAEAVVADRSPGSDGALPALVRGYLRWVLDLSRRATDPDLLDLRIRAAELSRLAEQPELGVFVPLLPYQEYEATVKKLLSYINTITREIADYQQQIETRKTRELIIDVAKTLNENIQASGQLLQGFVEANARHAANMAGFYDSMIERGRSEHAKQLKTVEALEGAVFTARADVKTAIENLKGAIAEWEKMEWLKFSFSVASDIFTVGKAFAGDGGGGPGALLKAVVDRVQDAVKIVETSGKFHTTTEHGDELIKEANDILTRGSGDLPSQLPWEELSLHMTAVMAKTPDQDKVKPAKADFLRAFSVLVLRAKTLLTARSSANQLAREIYVNQRQKAISDAQAETLTRMGAALRPKNIADLDRSRIDLVGLTGHLQFVRNQMLAMLAKAFALQDRAMQYENLQPPTPIGTFSLLTFGSAIVTQQNNANQARTNLKSVKSSKATFRCRVEGVPVAAITGGNRYPFAIKPDSQVEVHVKARDEWIPTNLTDYVTVKVSNVTAAVGGVASSSSRFHQVQLDFVGNPFFDLDLDRRQVHFRTPARQQVYEYATDGNQLVSDSAGDNWSAGVSPVTPFSSWEVSLPKSAKNKALKFTGPTVDLTLTFVLDARVRPAPQRMRAALPRGVAALAAAPPKETLLAAMAKQGSALNGWDVVFSMSLAQINASLAKQYDELKTSTAYKNVIKVTMKNQGRPTRCDITEFEVEYGYPKLEFLNNNDQSVKLEMAILKGSVRKCEVRGKCADAKPPFTDCDDPVQVAGKTLTATVPIRAVEGRVRPQQSGAKVYSVVLDFAEGAFTAKDIEMSDEEKIEFNAAIKAYFVTHKVEYVINSLDLSNIATLDDLRPNEFRFRNLLTPAGERMLQVFIATASRKNLDASQMYLNNVPEPLPFGYQCSLMISSKILFGSVLPHASTNGWRLAGSTISGDASSAWQAVVQDGQLRGTGNFSKASYGIPGKKMMGERMVDCSTYFSYSSNQAVSWPVRDMKIHPTPSGQLQLTWDKEQKTSIDVTIMDFCYGGTRQGADTATVTVSARATLPLAVEGPDRDQRIKINISNQGITISGRMAGGNCLCPDVQAQLNRSIDEQLRPQMVSQLNLTFQSVSVFALKNLLFPTKNQISLKEVYAPGDMLILGNFV